MTEETEETPYIAQVLRRRFLVYWYDEEGTEYGALLGLEEGWTLKELTRAAAQLASPPFADADDEALYLVLRESNVRVFSVDDLRDGDALELCLALPAFDADEFEVERRLSRRPRKGVPLRYQALIRARLHARRRPLWLDASSSASYSSDSESDSESSVASSSADSDESSMMVVETPQLSSSTALPEKEKGGKRKTATFGKGYNPIVVPPTLSPEGRAVLEYFTTLPFFSAARVGSFLALATTDAPDGALTVAQINAEAKAKKFLWQTFTSTNLRLLLNKEIDAPEERVRLFVAHPNGTFTLSPAVRATWDAASSDQEEVIRILQRACMHEHVDELSGGVSPPTTGANSPTPASGNKRRRIEEAQSPEESVSKEVKKKDKEKDKETEHKHKHKKRKEDKDKNEKEEKEKKHKHSGRGSSSSKKKGKDKERSLTPKPQRGKVKPSIFLSPPPKPLLSPPTDFPDDASAAASPLSPLSPVPTTHTAPPEEEEEGYIKPRVTSNAPPLKEFAKFVREKEREKELADRAAQPPVDPLDALRRFVRSTFTPQDADATMAISGIPHNWDGDGARNRVVRAASGADLNVRNIQNPKIPDWWLITLSNKFEAEAMNGAVFTVEAGKKTYELKLHNLWE